MARCEDGFEEPRLCERCGEVIGVYEPIIRVVGGAPVRTSLAAQDAASEVGRGAAYHAACYEPTGSAD